MDLFGLNLDAPRPDPALPRGAPYLSVPADIYMQLFGFLDFRSMAALGSTCKTANATMKSAERLAFEHVRLSPMQALIRDRASQMPSAEKGSKNVYTIRAPMGFGKTITALAIAFANPRDKHHYVILVPPKAFDTWVREVGKVFGTASNAVTASTRVLFAHSSVGAHKRHIDNILEKAAPDDPSPPKLGPAVRAILVSTTSPFGEKLSAMWGSRVIVDEAHALTDRSRLKIARFRWAVLLSANVIEPRVDGHIWGATTMSGSYMKDTIPRVVMRRVAVEPYTTRDYDEAKSYTPPAHKIDSIANNLGAYISALTLIFSELERGQVALYLPDGSTGDAIADRMPKVARGWDIVVFVNATTKIRQFESLDRSVLLIRLNKSEALNILASHLIIIRPDWVNSIRYTQIIGRVLRPTNLNKNASVYTIVPRGVPSLRVCYYDALRRLMTENIQLPLPEYRASEFEKADACLRLCGSTIETAAPSEIVAALGIGFDSPADVPVILSNWAAETAPTLTLHQVRSLLGLVGTPESASAQLTAQEIDEMLGLI